MPPALADTSGNYLELRPNAIDKNVVQAPDNTFPL
jgi:hypothetical protein